MITRRAMFAAAGACTSAMRKMLYAGPESKGQAFTASLIELERASSGRLELRAGFPSDWRVADTTGSNAKNTTNDIPLPGRRTSSPS